MCVSVCVFVCGSWPSSYSLFIELRLLPVSGAVPSRQEGVGGERERERERERKRQREREGERDEEREEV